MMDLLKKAFAKVDQWISQRDWPLWLMAAIGVLVIIVLLAR